MNRRSFLRKLGIGVAIPFLPSITPKYLRAQEAMSTSKRIAFIYAPNGKIMNKWTPKEFGKNYTLPATLQPLQSLKNDFQILTGLAHQKAYANGDGAGDHARANATFLTACQAKKTSGPDINIGISIDQAIANQIGSQTLLPSMELSCDSTRTSGSCDSGYSCAYQFNLSWKSNTTPMPPESSPKLAYNRLFNDPFGSSNQNNIDLKKSLLEETYRESKSFQNKLGIADKSKLEEYLESLKSLEDRIAKIDSMNNKRPPGEHVFDIPENYLSHIRMTMDIIAIAFQTDATRVISFLLAHEGSNRSFPQINVNEAHHQLSHHKGNESNIKAIEKIDLFYVESFAYLLNKLKNIKENDRPLLDNCMVLYGSGISDGNSHSHKNLPILLAGGQNNLLKPGQHVKFADKTPMANLYIALAKKLGINMNSFGDSNGIIENI